jgi:hypothetical protein
MAAWSRSLPLPFQASVTTEQFAVAVGIFTLLGFLVTFVKFPAGAERKHQQLVAGFAGMLFLNVFFPHLIATVVWRQYAPDEITALLVNLPMTSYLFWKMLINKEFTRRELGFLVAAGGRVGIVPVWVLLKIGEWVTT